MNINYILTHMDCGDTEEAKKEAELHRWEIYGIDDYLFRPLSSYLKQIDWIVDIGANIGTATLAMKLNFQNCHSLSIEPCPETFKFLKQNIEKINFYDKGGVEYMSYIDNSAYGHEGTISISPNGRGLGWGYVIEGTDIPRHTLEYYFDQYGIRKEYGIKIDAEGAEQYLISEWNYVEEAAFFCAELHWGKTYEDEPRQNKNWHMENIVKRLGNTHNIVKENYNSYVGTIVAIRKDL